MINQDKISIEDILHKTTYVWKEEQGCGVVINNDGRKIILNPKATAIWKLINDEDSIKTILSNASKISQEEGLYIIGELLEKRLVTNEDFIWSDDLL